MDYSNRANSKGLGGVADRHETSAHTRRRVRELLSSQALDLEKDPYVVTTPVGLLECRLCLTTHANEALYVSHVGGRKHIINLERRRLRDKQPAKKALGPGVEKRLWRKIGQPKLTVTKVRDAKTLKMGLLVVAHYPQAVSEPVFTIMLYYELSAKNQGAARKFMEKNKLDFESRADVDPAKWLYLVLSAEPYENVAVALPAQRVVPQKECTEAFWWHWDRDPGHFFVQLLFN